MKKSTNLSPKWSRRDFALGVGATLLAAPFIKLLQPTAMAAPGDAAERLIIFFSPNGTIPQHWRPSGSGTQFSFPKGSILEPLAPYKNDLVVVDGLDFYGASNHEGGMAAMLTGKGGASTETGGRSLDQYVANKIGDKTRFRSLEFGVQTSAWGGNTQTRMSYRGPGQYVPPNDNPVNVYKRIWGDVASGPGQVDELLKRRQSVLDLVKEDLGLLKRNLGKEEQQKLDRHLQSIREAEKGIQGSSTSTSGGCKSPAPPAAVAPYDHKNFPAVGKAQTDLMVASLACGMTKVASIQWSHTVGPPVFSWLGIKEGHHALSHMGDHNKQGVANFVKAERWFTEQFAYLLKSLKNTPDPGGKGTLLDTSLVLWAKELGDSRLHVCKSVPFIVAGKGGGLKTGRYLQYKNESHQKLLVSMCHGMGLTNASFGDPSKSTGPLSGLI
ncbi:MAG TPA: Tat (twin-arginine translocation) pathway signal sequence domain protein [Myxococcales bacterium]|nr:Tat (twin-arginine translocation) pathway signal sequence domain protein [Deltaproteobacteria bacterium]HAA58093.1 Tat (twin-arginine translocation) pathway signal sequence domain protein [Myxococcales bacterium]|tara:strand:- start:2164 stop:3483 length:1320 start_codon:yes stop_codon:yes gene_type:complete